MADTEPSITAQPVKLAEASEGNDEEASPPKSPSRRPTSPRKEPSGSPEKSGKKKKKESFQWNTPADEFAEDVGSEDEGEYDDDAGGGVGEGEGEEGGFSFEITVNRGGKDDIDEDMARFLAEYSGAGMPKVHPRDDKPIYKPKNRYPCPKCPRVWNFPWELRRHVLTHYRQVERAQASTFKCDDCGKGFQWKRDLAQHRRLHTGEKLLVCSVCNKKFTTRQALLHHVVVHTGEKPFQCALCGNRFTQPANLRTHMKKKHEESDARTSKCPHCNENLPSIVQMHQHIIEDHQDVVAEQREKQEMTRLAKMRAKEEREILREENRRKREESKKRNVDYHNFKACKGMQEWEINYEFHIGEGLARGVDWDRTPSNAELICEICDRVFAWRYELMFHNLCHKTDENGLARNRVCPECDTAFKVPIGLKHHLLLHTGELPFLCLHCWRSFSSHIDLKLHIRKEHLFHLEPLEKKPVIKKYTPRIKTEKPPRARKPKSEKMAAATAMVQGQQIILGGDQSEAMQLMVANQDGENQTIFVDSDGNVVQAGDQDMIVVIQSDDALDQSQGLVVLDPSQLQQMVGADGTPITVVQTEGGETMTVVAADADQAVAAVSAAGEAVAPGTIITTADGQQHTVVSADDNTAIAVSTDANGGGVDPLVESEAAAQFANGAGTDIADSKLGIIAAAAEKAAAMETENSAEDISG